MKIKFPLGGRTNFDPGANLSRGLQEDGTLYRIYYALDCIISDDISFVKSFNKSNCQ